MLCLIAPELFLGLSFESCLRPHIKRRVDRIKPSMKNIQREGDEERLSVDYEDQKISERGALKLSSSGDARNVIMILRYPLLLFIYS